MIFGTFCMTSHSSSSTFKVLFCSELERYCSILWPFIIHFIFHFRKEGPYGGNWYIYTHRIKQRPQGFVYQFNPKGKGTLDVMTLTSFLFQQHSENFPSSTFHKYEEFSTNILEYLLNVIWKSWLVAIDLVHNYSPIQKGDWKLKH